MSPSKEKSSKPADPEQLLALMDRWPSSWRGSDDDIPIGEGLVAVMRPFIVHLCSLGLARETVRNHLDNCWAIGGEIIRDVIMRPELRGLLPRKLILDAIAFGEAPVLHRASEEEQRGCDDTARKLLKFLTLDARR